ncbi:biotin carboxylase N-terminal domain-containing protein [Paraconexibacter algicola]|uniref:Acetyl/propionyl-CoA carboxylase subunit alpha n=1 Tax=Paraconexibacter algicola TaxID=2133960 RepID=A0A2T4UIH8_9ACTN|nr:biotin carboxylase N-terminal domain-containing protein [Paraconexibacter algicola]PTL59044.1 acetyl/propionyl-CoA carboxylase subunit alpha [Paraconexibacter algicola]
MKTLLIANRGEIARRIIRTARAMGLRTVAVYSDADADMPFVREADVAVRLGGNTPAESYLRVDALLDAARRTGADAVHPGYGFLAESSSFARACADAGVTFVGPTPEAIDAMGSKIGAKSRLRDAGVPVLPDADVTGLEGAALREAADGVGYPLLVKPSAGGGGKGMQVVGSADELEAAVGAARRLAKDAFGDDSMLLERFVERGRHVEIQILGDTHGTVTHLGERECSVQRRHQKVLEESPSVAVSPELRARMGDAAVAAGEAIAYVGAGTVEFLLAADGSEDFFFLEVNTRLQVEHPVTEEVTGVDLVREQLQIAAGAPIGAHARKPEPVGHSIEVRLYAEDPASDFLPQTGVLTRLAFPQDRPGLRVDAGVESGSEVSIYYDPMIAKVIAHAPTRAEAARTLAAALRQTHIDGLRTNRDFLVRLLEDERFLAGEIDTRFLDRDESLPLRAPLASPQEVRLAAAAAALARQAAERDAAVVQATLPSGWRNSPSQDQLVEYAHGDAVLRVTYCFRREGLDRIAVDDAPLGDVRLLSATAEAVVLEVDGVRHAFSVRRAAGLEAGPTAVTGPAGQVDLVEQERYLDPSAQDAPGSLLAPMPGSVIRVDVRVGDEVSAGTPLLVLEAMKMEHEIVAPLDGTVTELPVQVGAQVDAGSLLAAIEAPPED